MKSENPIEKNTGALELSLRQQEVLSALRSRETDRFHLSRWYLGALCALNNPYNPDRFSQAAQSLRELIEKLPRVLGIGFQSGSHGFKGIRDNLRSRFEKDKEMYAQGWKGHEINAHLNRTLVQFDDYLERNKQPTRREQIQKSLARIDPLARLLDKEIRDAVLLKRDQLFHLWDRFEKHAHHNIDSDFVEFTLSLEALERIVIDLLAPITAEDQQEILSILDQPDRSESDVSRLLTLINRRGANFSFFFEHVSDAAWIPILEKEGYYSHPPTSEPIDEDRSEFPIWIPVKYLSKVAKDAPSEVVRILSNLPPVENPWVYDGILNAALNLSGSQSSILLSKMKEYARLDFHFLAHKFPELLNYWTVESQTSAALELAKALIGFQPDLKDKEKRARYTEDPASLFSHLEPVCRFRSWDYREIMTEGIQPLIEKEPLKTACILISAVTRMTYLGMHQDLIERDGDEDHSEVWYPRLRGKYAGYGEPKELLIYTMTSACEQVYRQDPDSIEALDEKLRKQRWKLSRRLRQHLYAHFPTEQTKPWIQQLITSHDDYGRTEYHYEFNLMVRRALECFGDELLSSNQLTPIFSKILEGPSKESFKEYYGDRFTDSCFAERQRRFHRMQLRPFASVLFGKYLEYFEELERNANEEISDEDYLPISETEAGFVLRRSPIISQELAAKSDQDILNYINAWQEERPFETEADGSFTEISIDGLAEAFQTAFEESILPNPDRIQFWVDNRDRIERPLYVRTIVEGMAKQIEEGNFSRLDQCLGFCEWVLTHPDQEREHDFGRGEQSRSNPNWARARQAVGDLVRTCTKKEVDAPISTKGRLTKLLVLLCTQYDWQLDKEDPEYLGSNDYLTTAINNARSRALEYLVNFGLWLKRNDPDTDFGEVKTILEERFAREDDLPLTLPERAILGANYARLIGLDETWALEHRSDFFPQKRPEGWQVAFGSYLRRFGPNIRAFEELGKEYEFGVQHLAKITRDEKTRTGSSQTISGGTCFSITYGVSIHYRVKKVS